MAFKRFKAHDIAVTITKLLAASTDSNDVLLDGSVEDVLCMLCDRLHLDVVFVAEFVDGKRVF